MKYVLALDVGTTSLKGVLFDQHGTTISQQLQEYDLVKQASDLVELDPELYWQAAREVLRAILSQSGIEPKDILSVGVTSQGETLIVLDEKGQALRPAIVWLDNRSQQQAQAIAEHFSIEDVHKTTGQQEIVPTWTATKILWIRENQPDIFRKADKYLLVEDYLLFKLTGQYITDCALNPSTLYFDIVNNRWWKDMLDLLGISARQLPELTFSGQGTFAICPGAAQQTGLSAQTLITTAPMDQTAGAIGAGNISPGIITETTGAALAICATFDRLTYDPQRQIPTYTHGLKGKYLLLPWVQTAGMALRWFRDELGGQKDYDTLCGDAAGICPGAEGLIFLPYLSGAGCPDMDPAARGLFWPITLAHRQAHFTRAILESVGFVLRRNIEFLQSLGSDVKEIRSLGGAAKSDLWLQIKADMLNIPVVVMQCQESTCLGVAMLSCLTTGLYKSLAQAADNMVQVKKTILPEAGSVEKYDDVYSRYLDLHQRAKQLFTHSV